MEILNRLLEVTIYAVALFFILMVLKKVFKHKLSPRLHFVIWFILIARLCIPFTIDSSLRPIVIPESTISIFQSSAYDQSLDSQQESVSNTGNEKETLDSSKQSPPLGFTDYFSIVWLCGIALLSSRMLVNMTSMNRKIKRLGMPPSFRAQEILNACKAELGVSKEIKLCVLPNLSTPALTVGLRPKIVLPENIHERLGEEQLALVIKHELMHYKRRDHLTALLMRVIEIVYWFNPIVWLMSRHISRDMESACDSMVVMDLDSQQKKNYALSLVQLSSQGRILQSVLGLVFGNNQKVVEERIRGVFRRCCRKRGVIAAAVIISALLFIGCFTTIFQPVIKTEIADNSQTTGSTSVTEDPNNLTVLKDQADLDDDMQIIYCTVDNSVRDATGTILKQDVICYTVVTAKGDGKITTDGLTGEILYTTESATSATSVTLTSEMVTDIEASLRDNNKSSLTTP